MAKAEAKEAKEEPLTGTDMKTQAEKEARTEAERLKQKSRRLRQ